MALSESGGKQSTLVILTSEQNAVLAEQAKRMAISKSALLRLIVAQWLDEHAPSGKAENKA